MPAGFALFETAVGRCGVAWADNGIIGVQLPQPDDQQTRTRLRQRSARDLAELAPPPDVEKAIGAMRRLLEGERLDLSYVQLDMGHVNDFNRSVYDIARTIPAGETLTYGDIAKRLGGVQLSRDVGQALGQNPFPIVVPCHRVLAAGGKPGGFSANGGVKTKLKMLEIEGAVVNHTPSLFDDLPAA